MNKDLLVYIDNMNKPWSQLYYRLVWEQLPDIKNAKILDFGSGLGITADHLAKDNDVTAIEPNPDMVEIRTRENRYTQIVGGIAQMRELEEKSFDMVLCHNVLEYAGERQEIVRELCRILKPNGLLSLIKHNHTGRIMSKAILENNLDEVISLLNGEAVNAAYFGQIGYYHIDDISNWLCDLDISIVKVLGIRALMCLHPDNETRYDPDWQDNMFDIEMRVSGIDAFRNIAFYHHIILKKNK